MREKIKAEFNTTLKTVRSVAPNWEQKQPKPPEYPSPGHPSGPYAARKKLDTRSMKEKDIQHSSDHDPAMGGPGIQERVERKLVVDDVGTPILDAKGMWQYEQVPVTRTEELNSAFRAGSMNHGGTGEERHMGKR